jgi:putative ABC transport system permease protein
LGIAFWEYKLIEDPKQNPAKTCDGHEMGIREWSVTLGNALCIALETLWTHKLRSMLTLFGIIIGISAVVLVGATLGVVREMVIKSTAATFGTNNFVISQVSSIGNLSRKDLADKMRKNPEIYRSEAERLAARLKGDALTAITLGEVADVQAGNKTFLTASITGSNAAIQIIRDIELSSGRFFTETENLHSQGVAVIGQDLVNELFPIVDPLGKRIRIMGRPFRVIGIQEKQGSSFGNSLDRSVYIPLRAYEKIWGSRHSTNLNVQPNNPALFTETQEAARFAFRIMRRLRPNAPDNFDILTPEADRNFIAQIIELIGIAILPISSVALIVAGIVVMNMMLVSIAERIQEIGLRKSLGARNRDIFTQVLFESTILTILGGSIGLLFSYLAAFGLGEAFGSKVHIQLDYALMALVMAAAIGIGAGIFPAYSASRMPPVEALNSEI